MEVIACVVSDVWAANLELMARRLSKPDEKDRIEEEKEDAFPETEEKKLAAGRPST